MPMSEKDEILREIQTLIDEQMEALKGKLPAMDAKQYAKRQKRIEQLLQKISGIK
jgi:hypothetical protein